MIFVFNKIKTISGPVFLLGSLVIAACRLQSPAPTSAIVVAAASDLTKASEPLAAAFERTHGAKITFSFGASGQLEQMVRQGAPFDVYAPAARSYCESLRRDGLVTGECRVFALGRLVAWSGSIRLQALSDMTEKRILHIALANPSHAPYGLAAQQALEAAGLWQTLQPKFVYAESVAHAFQMAKTGNAEIALVALALVAKETGGAFLAIDPNLHKPIEQTAAVLKDSRNLSAASAFRDFLAGAEAQGILAEYGFGHP